MCFRFVNCCGGTQMMPLTQVVVEGHENFLKKVEELDAEASQKKIPFVVIIKSTNSPDGTVWCRDCGLLDKMMEDKLPYMKVEGIILIAKVGTLEEWEPDSNDFKKDETLKLTSLPTAYRWKNGHPLKRLETPEILRPDIFKALFGK